MSAARGIYSKNPINFAKISHKNPGGNLVQFEKYIKIHFKL
jgi:hypothetical protein